MSIGYNLIYLYKKGDVMYDEFLADRLAQLRMKRGVSARDMSLSLGQSESYINTIENKKALPSMTVFFYICEYLGIKPKDFFDEENTNPQLLNELTEEQKTLEDEALRNMLSLARLLNNRK